MKLATITSPIPKAILVLYLAPSPISAVVVEEKKYNNRLH